MSNRTLSRGYNAEFELANGANLEMLMFSDIEHRWIFKHRYVHSNEADLPKKVDLVNDLTLVVNYNSGVAQDIDLTMNIVFPNKLGKEYFLGIDISKGSQLFAQFIYEKQENLYQMKSVNLGSYRTIHLDSSTNIVDIINSDGLDLSNTQLVKPMIFPFPLKNRIENECGMYKVPFLRNNNDEVFLEFPNDYRKKY